MSNEQSEWPPEIAHCSLHIAHSGARFHTRRFLVPRRGQYTVEAFLEPSARSRGFSRPVPPKGGTTNDVRFREWPARSMPSPILGEVAPGGVSREASARSSRSRG